MPHASETIPARPATVVLLAVALFTWAGAWIGGAMSMAGTIGRAPAERPTSEWAPPSEFVATAAPEIFDPDTLFEIINGDADLYLKAGFERLETRQFQLTSDPREELSVFVYRMTGHRSAFAVYSVRRDEDARPYPLTRFAYRYRNGLFLVHGPYYVEILATGDSSRLAAAMDDVATAFIEAHAVMAEPIAELDLFPPEGLVPGSTALHPANAFGFDGFADLFTARYRSNAGPATAFLKPCPSHGAAVELADAYQTFLTAYDGVAAPQDPVFPEGRLLRVMDAYTLVFVHGHTVAGVQDAGTPELAARLASALKDRLTMEERK